MKLKRRSTDQAYALLLVSIFGALAFLILGSVLSWCGTNHLNVQRNNYYYRAASAAEAATEKVLAAITADYQAGGDALVLQNLDAYRAAVPTSAENSAWSAFVFNDARGNQGRTYVERIAANEYRLLDSQYRGLRGYSTPYRIISNARDTSSPVNVTAGIRQDIEVATIPIFQFAIFYNIDLEINPGPDMTITGPVHCNQTNYLEPQATLTFLSDVTAAGEIIYYKKPGDPSCRSAGTIEFKGEHDALVSTLTLPIGTNNSPQAVREVVEMPSAGESPTSDMGRQRYYNKADMIILVNNSGVQVKSGLVNNFSTTIPASQYNQFLSTTPTFFNKREGKNVRAIQIDISRLLQWNATNTLLRPILPFQDVRTIYVADQRTQSASTESGVRLINGQTILPKGLTIATPNPLYVKGHYNSPVSSHLGTTNTSQTKPASLIADAVTILSGNWNDANAGSGLSCRVASPTTVNAALLAGIVETTPGSYSGGVENFPRFLEDWSGRIFTYNGSMVVMFPSKYATAPWAGTGAAIGIYNPPIRNWAFDQNFRDVAKLPPGTPEVRALVRGGWMMVKPNSVQAVN